MICGLAEEAAAARSSVPTVNNLAMAAPASMPLVGGFTSPNKYGHSRWNHYSVPNNYGHSRWHQFKAREDAKAEQQQLLEMQSNPTVWEADRTFTFTNAEGTPGMGWTFENIPGALDVSSKVTFSFDFTGIQNLNEAKHYAWQVLNADGGISIDGQHVPGDFVNAEFSGIDSFTNGQFAYWQGNNEYLIEYIPNGDQSEYDPELPGNEDQGSFGSSVDFGLSDFVLPPSGLVVEGAGTLTTTDETVYDGSTIVVGPGVSPGVLDLGPVGSIGDVDLAGVGVIGIIPEPSTTSLLLLGGMGWLLRRRK